MRYTKLLLFCIVIALLASCSVARQAVADKDTLTWRYEIEPTSGQAVQGSILVKVWSYSKDKYIPQTQAGKNAVHGVLFKGVAALNNAYARVPMQRPIVTDPNAETKYADFFETFFKDGGKYMKFINFVKYVLGDFTRSTVYNMVFVSDEAEVQTFHQNGHTVRLALITLKP